MCRARRRLPFRCWSIMRGTRSAAKNLWIACGRCSYDWRSLPTRKDSNRVPGDLTIELAGEEIILLPERAIYWPRAETLFVADTHWGKDATFRAAAIAVPGGTLRD